jgi:hypothetical protein
MPNDSGYGVNYFSLASYDVAIWRSSDSNGTSGLSRFLKRRNRCRIDVSNYRRRSRQRPLSRYRQSRTEPAVFVPRRAVDTRGTDRRRRQSLEPFHLARHPTRPVPRRPLDREERYRGRVDHRPAHRRQDSREPDHHGHPRAYTATSIRKIGGLVRLGRNCGSPGRESVLPGWRQAWPIRIVW